MVAFSFIKSTVLLIFRGFEGHEEGAGDFDGVTGDFGNNNHCCLKVIGRV